MVWDLEGKRKEALKTFTDDDLASELERRRKKAEGPPPICDLVVTMIVQEPHGPALEAEVAKRFNSLRSACIARVEDDREGHPDPEDHYIVEAAMTLFYGPDYWEWLRRVR